MLAFHIGGDSAEFVRVSNIRDNGDGWYSADVRIVVGGFEGEYSAAFNSWAFSDFAAQLEQLYKVVSGSAVFTSYEAQLELTMTCDVRGAIELKGEAMDLAGTGNRLTFRLNLDQTHLPVVIASLRLMLERYPPRAV